MSRLRGDGIPLSVSGRAGYRMEDHLYSGHCLYIVMRTDADLSDWVPEPLQVPDPHLLFLKLYQLRRRPVGQAPGPAGYWQYHEACVTTLASLGGAPSRHYNLFMWVDRDWATWKGREVFGWPKKLCQMDMTFLPAGAFARDLDSEEFPVIRVNVSRWGYQVLEVDASLDPSAREVELPPLRGFYGFRRIPAPAGGTPISEIVEIDPIEGWAGPAIWGSAEIRLHDGPDEELSLLGPVTVTGSALRQVRWTLPAHPARVVARADIADIKEESHS